MDRIKVTDGREFGYYRIENIVLLQYIHRIGVYGLAVYNVFCMHADNGTREAWPPIRTIAATLGISPTTVYQHIEVLERCGLLITMGKRGRVASYKIAPLTTTVPRADTLMVQNKKSKKAAIVSPGEMTVSASEHTVSAADTQLYSELDLELSENKFSQNTSNQRASRETVAGIRRELEEQGIL